MLDDPARLHELQESLSLGALCRPGPGAEHHQGVRSQATSAYVAFQSRGVAVPAGPERKLYTVSRLAMAERCADEVGVRQTLFELTQPKLFRNRPSIMSVNTAPLNVFDPRHLVKQYHFPFYTLGLPVCMPTETDLQALETYYAKPPTSA